MFVSSISVNTQILWLVLAAIIPSLPPKDAISVAELGIHTELTLHKRDDQHVDKH